MLARSSRPSASKPKHAPSGWRRRCGRRGTLSRIGPDTRVTTSARSMISPATSPRSTPCCATRRKGMDSDLMRWVKAQADDPNANPRFRELLAALEAAREDAERYRWLRERMTAEEIADEAHAMLALRVVGPIAKRPADPDYCDELDAAIDQARGKGVQDEA